MVTKKTGSATCVGCGFVKCRCGKIKADPPLSEAQNIAERVLKEAVKRGAEFPPKDTDREFIETPASDAESGVTAGDNVENGVTEVFECPNGPQCPACGNRDDAAYKAGIVMTFGDCFESLRLPTDLLRQAPGEYHIGALADIAFASGYFEHLTPAQIAIHIIAGRSLGLDDLQSVFDLTIGPGPSIQWRDGQPYQAASDAIELEKAATNSGQRFEKKLRDTLAADRATPETASSDDEAENVIPGNFNKLAIVEAADGTKFDISDVVSAIDSQKNDNLPDKPPVLNADSEDRQPEGGGSKTQSPAANLASAGAIEDEVTIGQRFVEGWEKFADDLAAGNPGMTDEQLQAEAYGMAAQDAELGSVTPDPALTAAAAEITSDVSAETVAAWRAGIVNICTELSIPVNEKTDSFDLANVVDKRKKFNDAQIYYAGKVEAVRAPVLEALAADGKDTPAKQAGFFLYAEVGTDPAAWNYSEAVKASAAAALFIKKP